MNRDSNVPAVGWHIRPSHAVIALAVLAMVVIVTSVTLLLWNLRAREIAHSRGETVSLARMLVDQTHQSFEGVDLVLRGVQERLNTEFGRQLGLDNPAVHLLLSARMASMRQLSALFLVDPSGHVVNTSSEKLPAITFVGDRQYFKAFTGGMGDRLYVDRPVHNRNTGEWTLHLSRPLFEADGRLKGVAVASLNVSKFERLYSALRIDGDRPLAIYFLDGTLAASLPHRDNMVGIPVPELAQLDMNQLTKEIRLYDHRSGDGSRHTFALARLERFPMVVSVADDEANALATWRETAVPIALGALLMAIVIAVAAAVLVREQNREEALARALREATARYQQTLMSVMDGIVAVDENQTIVLFNPAAESMFGYDGSQVLGQPLSMLLPDRLRDAHMQHVTEFIGANVAYRTVAPKVDIVGRRADGTEFPLETTISRARFNGKVQLNAVLRDVTDHRRAEAGLREMNQQLRSLSASLQDVREQERSRIARELHDDLGQKLTGLKLDLSWLGGRMKDGREAPPDKVDAMRHLLDDAIVSVRRISTELRPQILDDLGFGDALTWQATEFAKRSNLEIDLQLDAADMVRDDATATAFFRIAQESLNNIVRHAQASKATLSLVEEGEELVFRVSDNGRGMPEARGRGGIGLVSMRERATSLGGSFHIRSGEGTVVEVRLPRVHVASPNEEESDLI